MHKMALGTLLLGFALGACGDSSSSGNNDNLTNGNDAGVFQCGNGEIEGLEACDNGAENSDTVADACRTDCTLARCGDGVTDSGEVCDESVANSDTVPDACRTDCSEAACGDGVVDVVSGETCDNGPDVNLCKCLQVPNTFVL